MQIDVAEKVGRSQTFLVLFPVLFELSARENTSFMFPLSRGVQLRHAQSISAVSKLN